MASSFIYLDLKIFNSNSILNFPFKFPEACSIAGTCTSKTHGLLSVMFIYLSVE